MTTSTEPSRIAAADEHHLNDEEGKHTLLDDADSEEIFAAVKEGGFELRRAIDADRLTDALKAASDILWVLGRPAKSHVQYFHLYCLATTEVARLTVHLLTKEHFRIKRNLINVYEAVQHCGNVVPRLYLMCIAGAALLGSSEVKSSVVLDDLCRMLKSCQNPLRGLYCRYFAINTLGDRIKLAVKLDTPPQSDKPHLAASWPQDIEKESQENPQSSPPTITDTKDTRNHAEHRRAPSESQESLSSGQTQADERGQPSADVCCTVRDLDMSDAFEFYMKNVVDCNKLLTRLGYAEGAGAAGREARRTHAFLLRAVICNIADLPGLDCAFFSDVICPRLLELVATLKDPHSQALLLASLLRCFRSDFLLLNIGALVTGLFESRVADMAALFDTLSEKFGTSSTEASGLEVDPNSVDIIQLQLIDLIQKSLQALADYASEITTAEVSHAVVLSPMIAHWPALVSTIRIVLPLALSVTSFKLLEPLKLLLFNYAAPSEVVFPTLRAEHHELINQARRAAHPEEVDMEVARILETALARLGLEPQIVDLANGLFAYVSDAGKCALSDAIASGLAQMSGREFASTDGLSSVLNIATPFLLSKKAVLDLARATHKVKDGVDAAGSTDHAFTLLAIFRAACDTMPGEANFAPLLAAILYEAASLLVTLRRAGSKSPAEIATYDCKAILHFMHACARDLKPLDAPELAFAMCLHCAVIIDQLDTLESEPLETATYEFLSMALSVFEEAFTNSKEETSSVLRLINVLQTRIFRLTPENCATLTARACNYAARLLRKDERALAILRCAHLFWKEPIKSEERVVECLQKAVKIAEATKTSEVPQHMLMKEVLSSFEYFQTCGNSLITSDMIQVVRRIHEASLETSKVPQPTAATSGVAELAAQKYLQRSSRGIVLH